MHKEIPVALCFDKNYANQAAITTHSIAINCKSNIKFYWVIPPEDLEAVKALCAYMHNTFGLNIKPVSAFDDRLSGWKTGEHFSHAVYLRLLIPYLIDDPKVIYFDSDILVLDDISSLFSTPLGEHLLAGVADNPGGVGLSRVPRATEDVYINSGMHTTLISQSSQEFIT
jgi:lipopolysaccharide biosynthesis glycosyltransferase